MADARLGEESWLAWLVESEGAAAAGGRAELPDGTVVEPWKDRLAVRAPWTPRNLQLRLTPDGEVDVQGRRVLRRWFRGLDVRQEVERLVAEHGLALVHDGRWRCAAADEPLKAALRAARLVQLDADPSFDWTGGDRDIDDVLALIEQPAASANVGYLKRLLTAPDPRVRLEAFRRLARDQPSQLGLAEVLGLLARTPTPARRRAALNAVGEALDDEALTEVLKGLLSGSDDPTEVAWALRRLAGRDPGPFAGGLLRVATGAGQLSLRLKALETACRSRGEDGPARRLLEFCIRAPEPPLALRAIELALERKVPGTQGSVMEALSSILARSDLDPGLERRGEAARRRLPEGPRRRTLVKAVRQAEEPALRRLVAREELDGGSELAEELVRRSEQVQHFRFFLLEAAGRADPGVARQACLRLLAEPPHTAAQSAHLLGRVGEPHDLAELDRLGTGLFRNRELRDAAREAAAAIRERNPEWGGLSLEEGGGELAFEEEGGELALEEG